MELVEGKNCWIAPSKRDAKDMARCLAGQGDMRGFAVEEPGQEPYLIIFDSYGNTHHSAMMQLGLTRRRMDLEALIFWTNGGVLTDTQMPSRRMRVAKVFSDGVAEVLNAIAKELGKEFAWVTNDERLVNL